LAAKLVPQRPSQPILSDAGDADEDELTIASNAAADLVRAGKLDEAEQAARDLQVRFPKIHDGYDRLGMVHEARGENRQAADFYRKVIAFIREQDRVPPDPLGIARNVDPVALAGADDRLVQGCALLRLCEIGPAADPLADAVRINHLAAADPFADEPLERTACRGGMRRGEAHRCGEAQRRQLRRIEAGNIYVNRNMIGATRSAISTARPR
jgi:hypothetical protein